MGRDSLGGKLESCAVELKSWSQSKFGKVFVDLKKSGKLCKILIMGALLGIS